VPRRPIAAGLLALLTWLTGLAPGFAAQVAATSCSGWTSETTPPTTIHVFRHVTGAVDVVDFKVYAKNVLSREWIASWTTESLRSGALAVKNYAWYQVLHWRGGVNDEGVCFDVRDDTQDQVYDPSKPTYPTAASAVDDTWATLVTRNAHIFATYYNAGTSGEPCGSNANGWKAYQWGTQACGLDGMAASQIILTYYYPNVIVTNPPGGSPSPSPSPSTSPTPVPSASPSATVSPSPTASATAPESSPTPTPRPTPSATPKPSPSPPPSDQQPGGGQTTLVAASAPPPPPPTHPTAVVARAQVARLPTIDWTRVRLLVPGSGPLEWPGLSATDFPSNRAVLVATGGTAIDDGRADDPRLATFRAMLGPVADRLLRALIRITAGNAVAAGVRW
jgi:hypothetical protein